MSWRWRTGIARTLSVEDNLNPILDRAKGVFETVANGWPLYVAALLAFLFVALLGHGLASAKRLWRMVAPNPFVADLIGQSVRIVGLLLGLLLALSILDAMALFGAAAGSAGLVGLAVGFALKDTIENYVASIMLSLRQPFRADDHVVINSHEGIVVRLTSRATILMTLDGNHLRLPNADVFKGKILNYTLNPKRRFTFKLGVDAEDDPIEASAAGLDAMGSLAFLLETPKPSAVIEEVGNSNIVIQFGGWIDQDRTDFLKARSAAINVVKSVLENDGFTLPEPIYRLRLDGMPPTGNAAEIIKTIEDRTVQTKVPKSTDAASGVVEDVDVEPDTGIRHQVAKERQAGAHADLLNEDRPME